MRKTETSDHGDLLAGLIDLQVSLVLDHRLAVVPTGERPDEPDAIPSLR